MLGEPVKDKKNNNIPPQNDTVRAFIYFGTAIITLEQDQNLNWWMNFDYYCFMGK